MSLLDALDRAARLWAEAGREFGKHLRSDDETFGQATVADSAARSSYEEALEAVRAENAELRKAVEEWVKADNEQGNWNHAAGLRARELSRALLAKPVRAQQEAR